MAITSIGYPGTVAPGEDWADLQRTLGKHLAVDDPYAFMITAVPTGTRQVKVFGPGRAMGEGILDHLDAPVELVNEDLRPEVEKLRRSRTPVQLLAAMDAIATARERIDARIGQRVEKTAHAASASI